MGRHGAGRVRRGTGRCEMSARHWLATFTLAALVAGASLRCTASRRHAAAAQAPHAEAGARARPDRRPDTVPLRFDRYYTYEQVGEALQGAARRVPRAHDDRRGRQERRGARHLGDDGEQPEDRAPLPTSPASTWTATSTATRSRPARCASACSTAAHRLRQERADHQAGRPQRLLRHPVGERRRPLPLLQRSQRPQLEPQHPHPEKTTTATGWLTRTARRPRRRREHLHDAAEGPFGQYKTDPEDPRLMVRVKPGEKGEWTLLGEEGIDNDGDGKINEDGEGLRGRQPQLGHATGRRRTSSPGPATTRSRRRGCGRLPGSSPTGRTSSSSSRSTTTAACTCAGPARRRRSR